MSRKENSQSLILDFRNTTGFNFKGIASILDKSRSKVNSTSPTEPAERAQIKPKIKAKPVAKPKRVKSKSRVAKFIYADDKCSKIILNPAWIKS